MHAPKVTLCALAAIAAWEPIAAVSAAPPTAASAGPTSVTRQRQELPQAAAARPSSPPETASPQGFSGSGSGPAAALAQLKRHLSRPPAAEPTAAIAEVGDAATRLALQLASAGQIERAERMAALLPADQQAALLYQIAAQSETTKPTPAPEAAAPAAAPEAPVEAAAPAAPEAEPEPAPTTSPTPAPAASTPAASTLAPAPAAPAPAASAPAASAPAAAAPTPPQPAPATRVVLPLPPVALSAAPTPGTSAGFIFPLAVEAPMTSPFGWRTHPISGARRFHAGTDFGAPTGTPVLAAAAGTIVRADWTGGYGLAVEIEHAGGTDTFYAHLSQVLVQAGDRVEQGTVIGQVGSTGYSTGPHLHFEMRRQTAEGETKIDPMTLLGNAPVYAGMPAQPGRTVASQSVVSPAGSRLAASYSVASITGVKALALPASAPTGQPLQPSFSGAAADPGLQGPAPLNFADLKPEDYGYWADLCSSLVNSGQFTEALAACDRAVALQPAAVDPWLYRGQALAGLGQYTDAIAAYGYLLGQQPNHSAGLMHQCRAFLQLGNLEAALAACDQALAADQLWGQASPADAWQLRGQVLRQQQQLEPALQAYDQALQLEGGRADLLLDRCRALFDLGRYADVAAACDEALAIDQRWGQGSAVQALQLQGQALAKLGQNEAAIARFDQALNLDLERADTWTAQGHLFVDLGRHEEALASFQQALSLQPQSSGALLGQARVLNQQQQPDAALQAVEQALQGNQVWGDLSAGEAWSQRAKALSHLGQYAPALVAADRAVALQPNNAPAWNTRAVVLWHLQDYKTALASSQKAIALDPTYAQAWFNQGRLHSALAQPAQALTAYDEVLRLNPTQATADLWLNRGVALWQLGQLDNSLASLARAIALDPTSEPALINQGIVLLALEQPEAALASYDKALQLNPNATRAWHGRGTALEQLNRTEESKAAFAKAGS